MNVLAGLSIGFAVAFFIFLLAIMILGTMFNPSRDLVPPEPNATTWVIFDLTRPALVGLYVVVGILTLIVTFIFGLIFAKASIAIGLSTGLWLGLIVIWLRIVERVPTGVSVAVICILCGYLGGKLSLWVRNVVGRLAGRGEDS